MYIFKYLICFQAFILLEAQKVFPSNKNCDVIRYAVSQIEAVPGEFPYMFAVGWKSAKNESEYIYKCGGSLIHKEYVLTAAHCLYDSDDLPVVVRAGGYGLLNSTRVVIADIIEVIEHPDYEYPSTYNDIAILKLPKWSLTNFKIAYLADGDPIVHENLTAIGYGATRFAGAPSEKLLKVYLSIVANQDCGKYYPADASSLSDGLIDSQVCAADPLKKMDTCQGDSGGPLVRIELGKHYIMGITSFGIGCANGPPGVYTNVNKYSGWIDSVLHPWVTEEWPYRYGLHWRNRTTCRALPDTCGAVQISLNYLLLSAHCLYEFDDIPVFNPSIGSNTENGIPFDEIIIHPNYSHPSPYNDLALVKISGLISGRVTPIWLKDTLENDTLTFVNYGETSWEQIQRLNLLKTTLNYVPNSVCAEIYQNDHFAQNFTHGIASTHLCANDTQQLWDLGQGYADGLLIMHTNIDGVRTAHLVGITTFGVNCVGCPPAVFTRVSKYFDWIEGIVFPNNVTLAATNTTQTT